MRYLRIGIVLLIAAGCVETKDRNVPGESEVLERAALDYMEGWFEGDTARVQLVLHPRFVRRIAGLTVNGDPFFIGDSYDEFLDMLRNGGDCATPADQRAIEVRVLDRARTSASVRVNSAYYTEYLSMVKMQDGWKVVNVLWENVPNDKTAVPVAASVLDDYAGSYLHSSGARLNVIARNGRLFLQYPGRNDYEIFPENDSSFFTKGYKSDIRFLREGSGDVDALVKAIRHREVRYQKLNR